MCTDNGIKKGQRTTQCLTGGPVKKTEGLTQKDTPGLPDFLREIKNMPGEKGAGIGKNK